MKYTVFFGEPKTVSEVPDRILQPVRTTADQYETFSMFDTLNIVTHVCIGYYAKIMNPEDRNKPWVHPIVKITRAQYKIEGLK